MWAKVALNKASIRGANSEPKWLSNKLAAKYRCPSCRGHLRFPIQFEECGHHVCSSCLPGIMRVAPRCPSCQQAISKEKLVNDKDLQKEIQSLHVSCANKDKGCDWEDELRELAVHTETCGFVQIDCPNGCEVKFERRLNETHLNQNCAKRAVRCEFCQSDVPFDESAVHSTVCSEVKVQCPNLCTTEERPRHQLQQHLDDECPKQVLPCPFSGCNCEYRGRRTEIAQHLKDMPGIHLNLAGQTISIQKRLLEFFEERVTEQNNWIDLLARKVNAAEKTCGAQFIWKIDHYQERLEEARTGKRTTIISPPFLTSRHGYRLSVTICLCGDGRGKGKYVSLFICICRGENDALLVWPFSHRVIFTLLDQCDDVKSRRPIVCSIKPNTCKENKPFLGRPVTDRNASFGSQKFTDLEAMWTSEYIKDDTIFVRVDIDNEEMNFI